jgi:prephenate dehydrogenase
VSVQRKQIGIIGFGQFGRFMAGHLAAHFDVAVFDEADHSGDAAKIGVSWDDFERVASRGILIFAIPFNSLESVIRRAAAIVKPGTLCLDVCSVKIEPLRLMAEFLPATVEIVGTHPLFGPQSGSDGIRNLRIVVCPVRTTRLDQLKAFLSNELRLRVYERDAVDHDREMAHVQALTHFVARALDELHVEESELATVSYEGLMRAARLVSEDSWELFTTIQDGNPFADAKRMAFIEKLVELENRLGLRPEVPKT